MQHFVKLYQLAEGLVSRASFIDKVGIQYLCVALIRAKELAGLTLEIACRPMQDCY